MIILGWLVCCIISVLASVATVITLGCVNFEIRSGCGKKADYFLTLIPLTVASVMWYFTVVYFPFTVVVN